MTVLDSRVLDANSEALGVSVETLMANAGRALASAVRELTEGRALIICGSGNNGGDGYAAYAHLKDITDVCRFREPKSPLCRRMSENVASVPYEIVDLDQYDLIVDCVLGTGPEGKLREEYIHYIDRLNASGKRVLSCDVPTGFGTDTMVKPYMTVTFHDEKEGMGDGCGIVRVCDIGIPEEAYSVVGKGDFIRYPVPDPDSHKGQNGRLVIIAGGPYVGAPIMAAMASLRVGTDLVTVMTPRPSFIPIASYSPAYMVRRLSGDVLCTDDVEGIVSACSKADALLIGPGLGTAPETADAVVEILSKTDVPAIIDADGITCVAGRLPKRKGMIFTPHSAEIDRLTGIKNVSDAQASEFASANGCVILRKGPTDRIFFDGKVRSNRAGSPGMTVGGTGDVLAGTVAGLVSKGMRGFDAACLAAYICGKAGEKAFEKDSYGMTATDVIASIGAVLKEGLE